MIRQIIQFEYAFAFFLTLFFYWHLDYSLILFFVLLLVPDITMIGYAMNTKIGAIIYNVGHSFLVPLVLLVISFMIVNALLLMISLIWLAHIFMDRALGYGLKYTDSFKHTHIQSLK